MAAAFFTDSDLRELRGLQDSAMEDTCRIVHPDNPYFDEDTGDFSSPGLTLLYQGKCRVAPSSRSQGSMGQEATPWRTAMVYLPFDAPIPRVDDLVTIERSKDPEMNGRVMRILDVRMATYGAARQLTVESLAPGQQSGEV